MYSKNIFNNAPNDIVFEIFRYLLLKDHQKLAPVSKKLNLTVRDNLFWKARFNIHFPHHLDKLEITDTTDWYVEFINAYKEDYRYFSEFHKEVFYTIKENVDHDFHKLQKDDFERKDAKGISLYDWAYKSNNQKAFDYLYKYFFWCRKGSALLHEAIFCYQSLDKIKEFGLEKINKAKLDGKTPLYLASITGQVNLVMYLLKNNAKVNTAYFDEAPLKGAVMNGNMEIFKALLEKGADSKQEGWDCFKTTLFDMAILYGRLEMFKILLTTVNDIDGMMDDKGFDWLRWACRDGRSQIAEFLLNKGINPNKVNMGGSTLLQTACQFGQLKIIHVLLNFNVDINQFNQHEEPSTSLHTAICFKRMTALKTLLNTNQCILNINDKFGRTPLNLAEELGNTRAIFLLKRQKLVDYLKQKEEQPDDNYYTTFSFFGQRMNISYCIAGYSPLEKREAAKDLLAVLDGKKGVDLQQHKGALTNGMLELVYDSLKEYLPDKCRVDTCSFLCF